MVFEKATWISADRPFGWQVNFNDGSGWQEEPGHTEDQPVVLAPLVRGYCHVPDVGTAVFAYSEVDPQQRTFYVYFPLKLGNANGIVHHLLQDEQNGLLKWTKRNERMAKLYGGWKQVRAAFYWAIVAALGKYMRDPVRYNRLFDYAKLHIVGVYPDGVAPDVDNLVEKWAIDTLVESHILLDDNYKFINTLKSVKAFASEVAKQAATIVKVTASTSDAIAQETERVISWLPTVIYQRNG